MPSRCASESVPDAPVAFVQGFMTASAHGSDVGQPLPSQFFVGEVMEYVRGRIPGFITDVASGGQSGVVVFGLLGRPGIGQVVGFQG